LVVLSAKANPGAGVMTKQLLFTACNLLGHGPVRAVAAEVTAPESTPLTHAMMVFVLQVGIILLAAKTGHILFEKIRLPGVLGELAAGFFIGPYALGAISFPGFQSGLFPASSNFPVSVELYALCSVAAILLLFMAGLETDLKMLARFSLTGSMVGLGGVVVSFWAGAWGTSFFSRIFMNQTIGVMSPVALYMGVITTATSVGITARLLSENGKLDTPEGVTTLSGAVVDDVLGVILLAIVTTFIATSTETGQVNWSGVGYIALKALGVWLGFTVIGLLVARNLSGFLKKLGNRYTITMISLGLALIVAALFEKSGLAMIIGAYVMGMSLSNTDIVNILTEKLESLYEFLVPVFFCVMGMFVDFRVFRSTDILYFGIVFTALAVLAKIIGCGFPAMILKFNVVGALRIGIGMIPRGEVTLIMAGIGLTTGVLSTEMMGVVILMTLLSTLLAPPALIGLLKFERSGFRQSVKSFETPELAFKFPSAEFAKEMVYRLVDVFKIDGFIAHLLEKTRHIQLRRDGTVIGLRREQNRIIFTCQEDDFTYVDTAIIEVAAKLEHVALVLRKPAHIENVVFQAQSRSPGYTKMDVSTFMRPKRIIPRLKGNTKKEVIAEMLRKLKSTTDISDFNAVKEAVLTREQDMSTGMMNGIAIPHGHTDAVDKLMCVVGLKPDGVDFDSFDRNPAHIIILSVSSAHKPTPHTRFLSNICMAFDEKRRRDILTLKTPDDILEFFRSLHKPK
jgi:Kef-type K+ transport system membrane component KefB/mannitol/fructose-specific phosphotransferase system IIA component (Ntr-type)